MKLAKQKLEKLDACEDGIDYYDTLDKSIKHDAKKVIRRCYKDEHYNYAVWLIANLSNKKDRLRFAIYCANSVLPLFEKKYPQDKRPRQAIQSARRVLKNDTKANREKAKYASDAAYAYAASDAADDADAVSAYAAAYAYAASDADAACADEKIKEKIINYGLRLIK